MCLLRFGKLMSGGCMMSAKKKRCVLKIPVWFCNETDAQLERKREGKGRTNVKLLHSTQDGFSPYVIHYVRGVYSAFLISRPL